jgi:alcohol dehydrogenase
MRAVVYEGFGRPPEVREVGDPEPPPGGAVIEVAVTGLCRSDWHGWMGHDPAITKFPHVPGHELAGVVAAVGAGVVRRRPGDRVTVPFVCGCGRCAACAAGEHQVCERQAQPGFTHWGSYAEYVAIENADVNLVPLPAGIPDPAAAALGCRFATAFRAVVSRGRAGAGQWVAVYGCGGVGLSAVMIAAACGARVVAVDVSAGALELARRFGAAVCFDAGAPSPSTSPSASPSAPSLGDVPERVREATGGGAHVSLDAFGSPATCAASIESLRRRGRHVQVGLLPERAALPMDRVIAYELDILGSHGMAAHAYGRLIEMIGAGTLRPDLLVTRTIGLAEAPDALVALGAAFRPGITLIAPRPHSSSPGG